MFLLIFTATIGLQLCCVMNAVAANIRGIYVTQSTAENAEKLDYLIKESKETGISTFVVDTSRFNSRYAANLQKVHDAGIRYVARIIMFPHGGTHEEIVNKDLWKKRWKLAEYAISLGASAIQLDYIRYSSKTKPSESNAENVLKVINYFDHKLKGTDVKLQIDIFGVAAHRPVPSIGQDVELFADSVDAINPMVYPSHYHPYKLHSEKPYKTVLNSVNALHKQLKGHEHVNVFAYIEMYNYRYPMTTEKRLEYIRAQIDAARDSAAKGWYAWSANNYYPLLFKVLKQYQ